MNSPCSAKRRASDKDLPVIAGFVDRFYDLKTSFIIIISELNSQLYITVAKYMMRLKLVFARN